MSNEHADPIDAKEPRPRDAADDPRREWVTPAISELPISATHGTVIHPGGPDAGQYS